MSSHRQVLEVVLSIQATPPPVYPTPTIVTVFVEATRDPLAPWTPLQSWNCVRYARQSRFILSLSLSLCLSR